MWGRGAGEEGTALCEVCEILVTGDTRRTDLVAGVGLGRGSCVNHTGPGELRACGMVVAAQAAAGIVRRLDRCRFTALSRVQHGRSDRDAEDGDAQGSGDPASRGPARHDDQ